METTKKRSQNFFKSLKPELKKVPWPSAKETAKMTGVVILTVLVVGAIVWVFDLISNGVIQALFNLFG